MKGNRRNGVVYSRKWERFAPGRGATLPMKRKTSSGSSDRWGRGGIHSVENSTIGKKRSLREGARSPRQMEVCSSISERNFVGLMGKEKGIQRRRGEH